MALNEGEPLLHFHSDSGPERRHPLESVNITGPDQTTAQESPTKPPEHSDFTEFAKLVYRRLKVYRGIYLFYSIITFMLGLPVMVTGVKKQFFSDDEFALLDCPHYLGIASLLSCFISLWCALKNQIVICVLTLLSGILAVIAAMLVLVTSALALSKGTIISTETQSTHLSQQTHVIFIFSIGLLIASLAIVVASVSHLSARRAPRKNKTESKESVPRIEEIKDTEEYQIHESYSDQDRHRYSFASTISLLIKHELKEKTKAELGKEKLKKTVSCPNPNAREIFNANKNSDLLDMIVPEGSRISTHSLPVEGAGFHNTVLERWRRASFLTRYYNSESSNTADSDLIPQQVATSSRDVEEDIEVISAHESSV